MARTFTVVVERDEDGTWVVWVPSLPGCISQDRDERTALKLIEDAIKGWCGTKQACGEPIPQDCDPVPSELEGDAVVVHTIQVDV